MSNTPALNTARTHVYLHNDETGGDWECPLECVGVFLTRGWSYAARRDDSLDGLFDSADNAPGLLLEGGAVQTGFDPEQHTVEEVNAYLASVDGGELDRVLTLEAASKARVTVKDPRLVEPTNPTPGD